MALPTRFPTGPFERQQFPLTNAFFGSYGVNEADKTLTLRVDGSTYPNLEGTTQKRTITSLTAGDELTWTNPANKGEVAWKWVK